MTYYATLRTVLETWYICGFLKMQFSVIEHSAVGACSNFDRSLTNAWFTYVRVLYCTAMNVSLTVECLQIGVKQDQRRIYLLAIIRTLGHITVFTYFINYNSNTLFYFHIKLHTSLHYNITLTDWIKAPQAQICMFKLNEVSQTTLSSCFYVSICNV